MSQFRQSATAPVDIDRMGFMWRRLVPDQVTPEPPAHALLDHLRSAQVSSSGQKLGKSFVSAENS
jgi:hypothetical protein